MTVINPGGRAHIVATFSDEDGVIGDPTTVVGRVRDPDGSITSYTYGVNAELTRTALGVFVLEFAVHTAGRWEVQFTGSGAIVAAEESRFDVPASRFA